MSGSELLAGYLVWLACWSLVTFATYGRDKVAARRGRRRTPERTLHALALVGGAAGGWLGMIAFRHKRRSISVRAWLVVATVAQTAIALRLAGIGG